VKSTKKLSPLIQMAALWFNTVKPPFDHPHFRKFFAYAMQCQKILSVLKWPHILSSDLLPLILKSCPVSDRDIQDLQTSWHGKRLTIHFAYEKIGDFDSLAQLFKKHWEDLFPLTVHLHSLPWKELMERVLPLNEFDLVLFYSVQTHLEEISFFERCEFKDSPNNLSGWEHPEYQKILHQYRHSSDEKEKDLCMQQAEAILLAHLPIMPLYARHNTESAKNITFSSK
jgi:ABC-type oligopeptide transport system substrate-binding subunit